MPSLFRFCLALVIVTPITAFFVAEYFEYLFNKKEEKQISELNIVNQANMVVLDYAQRTDKLPPYYDDTWWVT